MASNIKIGDKVCCIDREYFGVYGVVVKQYYPTASEEQTMIRCYGGRLFHAPTRLFVKVGD
ncbi:MAG: hypothetical protein ACI4IS_00265 [Acutalibacteraceae bacterium]